MNKKNKLLTALVLSTTCLLSLASCKGEQGIKGDTGEKGDQGQKGDSGTPGKDGENGKDGASLLNGEGAPSDTLGNDGDTYIDSLTFDLYIKDNGKWILKGNTKGDKGDQGEKGDTGSKGDKGDTGSKGDKGNTGSSGSQGTKGDTAWSNTILYSEYGYITPSAASMIANNSNKISFTVHHNDYSNARFSKLILRNPKLSDDGELVISASDTEEFTTIAEDHDYTYETTMLEGGFVVSAEFVTKEDVKIDNQSTGIITSITSDKTECFVGEKVKLTINVNSDYKLDTITVNGESKEVTATENSNEYSCEVTMIKEEFIIKVEYYISKHDVEIDYSDDGGTVTCSPMKEFAGEKVTFTITPNDTHDLDKLTVGGEEVTPTQKTDRSGKTYYTYEAEMGDEKLKAEVTWIDVFKLSDNSINGSIKVYELNDGTLGDEISNYKSKKFKKDDKIRVQFIPEEASNDTLSSRFLSVIETNSNIETKKESMTPESGIYYKDFTFDSSNISLKVNFECLIRNLGELLIFDSNDKYHSNAIITVESFTSCDLTSTTWTPIEASSLTFNGNGLTINKLTINAENSDKGTGFFKSINNCKIDNLYFSNANISNVYSYAGVLTGKATNSTITNCKVTSSTVITSNGMVGLLVGCIFGDGTITGNTVGGSNSSVKGEYNVAGFVGYLDNGTLDFKNNVLSAGVTVKYDKRENSGNGSSYAAFIGNKADSTIDNSNTGSASFSSY